MADDDVELPDGRKVPRKAINALYELDKTWPGATWPFARPVIVATVMEALDSCKNNE
jgi:hypothetical protein